MLALLDTCHFPRPGTADPGGDEPPRCLRGDELDRYMEFHVELFRSIRRATRRVTTSMTKPRNCVTIARLLRRGRGS